MSSTSYYKDLLIRAVPGLHEIIFESITSQKKTGKVLDLGAGQGALSQRLHDYGFEVTAVDVDKNDFKCSGDINFIELDFNNLYEVENFLKENTSKYDIVLGIEVIEHVQNPWNYINQLITLAKPNEGLIVVSTPNITSWHSRLKFLMGGVWDDFNNLSQEQHINPVSPWELNLIMSRLKINDIKIIGAGKVIQDPTFIQTIFKYISYVFRPFQSGLLDNYCIVATGKVGSK
jgi:SAM-dependent methyltransferase